MPTPYETYDTAGQEISSTYEGRHITLRADMFNHPGAVVSYGDPVTFGTVADGNGVGVAFGTEVAAADWIAVDTEGIWALLVSADDDWGVSAVRIGDEIFINRTTCILSKIRNKNTNCHFGYALDTVAEGLDEVIAVKVHWDPDDSEEVVGQGAVFYEKRTAPLTGFNFREYRYRTICTSGDTRGMYMALGLNGAGSSGEAMRGRTIVEAVGVLTAHGGHFGLEYDTDGTLTGLGVGLRGTFMQPNRAAAATIAGGMSELWAEGASTDFGTATVHSIHRFVMDGDAAGYATADNVFEFANLSGVQLQDATPTCNHLLRCIINGNIRYIMVSTDVT